MTTGSLESRNPFTLVEDAFWEMLESRVDFCEMFPVNNRIKLNQDIRAPVKLNIVSGDIPQIGVFPTNLLPVQNAASNSAKMTIVWEIRLQSDDLRPHRMLLPMCWIIYRALADWQTKIGAVEWPVDSGKLPVKRMVTNGVLLGQRVDEDEDKPKGIKGWAALWAGETELWFDTTDLLLAE